MYNGDAVEEGPPDDVSLCPQAAFTEQLVNAIPEPSRNERFVQAAGRYPADRSES